MARDLAAAGGDIEIYGAVGDDIRAAGGKLAVSGQAGGEAVLAGGEVTLTPGASVTRDLVAAGKTVNVQGKVGGGARIYAGKVFINGTVNEGVLVRAGELVIGKEAVIGGNLVYESREEARIAEGAAIKGNIIYRAPGRAAPGRWAWLLALWWLVKTLAVLASALVFYAVFRDRLAAFSDGVFGGFWLKVLAGFLVLVAMPVAAVLLFMTVIGWYLAVITLFAWLALLFVSGVLGAVLFSALFAKAVLKKGYALGWGIIIGGVLIFSVLGAVPFAGWLFRLIFALAGLGGLWGMVYRILRGREV